ncbi:hypothetical protein Tco_0185478 [Tanacetum coccineum]
MNPIAAQQVARDNALVAPESRVQISQCNMRINPTKTPKEPTYNVVLDSLSLSPLYPTFLFKLDKKKCTIDLEVFGDVLQICPRLLNQEFDAPPLDKEIVTFIMELGHKGDIKSVTEVVVDQMHQPWRTFATIINKCLSGKTLGLDKIRLSRAQILWGMYYNKNVDYVELLWEDFVFKLDNRDAKKQEKLYYPRFTKAITHHFISKDKFVSKSDEYQVYGALLPKAMTNQQMRDSPAYKTYLAFATGAATPKKAKKFKKHASPSKKKALVVVEEPAEKPVKKHAARRESAGVQIRDTPDGSSKGADLESEVPDEPKGKSIDTSKGTGLKPGVPDVSKVDSSKSKYEYWGDSDDGDDDDDQQSDDESTESDDDKSADLNKTDDEEDDEFVHTPDDYVPTHDENVYDKEYEYINKQMYDDVNVDLKDAEPANEEEGDEEMTHAENVNAKHEEVNQEVVGETEYISMMDIKVQHEDPSIQTSPLFIIPVTVIPETSTAPATTIPPPIPPFISLQQQSTPILMT